MMEQLKRILNKGKHSLVVDNNGIHVFGGRGISDLYRLLNDSPEVLKGARVADKVVGKAAASLMILAGVRELYAEVASKEALVLLDRYKIPVSAPVATKYISNRMHTGLCPMELCVANCQTPEECLAAIERMIKTQSINK